MGIYYSNKIKRAYAPDVKKSTSRYDTKIRLVSDDGTKIRFIRVRDITFDDNNSTVHVVTPNEAFRPDIIAYEHYGSEKYSWVILAANNLMTPYDLVKGMKIILPSIASLQGSSGKLVTR